MSDYANQTGNYYSMEDLRNILRLIGSQYTMWTRFLIVSTASDINDKEILENRLYEVARDFSNLLLVYYDRPAVDKVDAIFRNHIKLLIVVINTLLSQDDSNNSAVITALKNSSINMAAALHDLNPHLNENLLNQSFQALNSMTIDEILKRKSKQYALDVYQYNFIEYQVLMIADFIWEGFLGAFYS